MNSDDISIEQLLNLHGSQVPGGDITQLAAQAYKSAPPNKKNQMLTLLVGEVYKTAPLAERTKFLEYLIRPLGVLSLVTVANGIFANLLLRSEWSNRAVRMDDAEGVNISDVTTLVDYVQQVSANALESLLHLITAEPIMTGSVAAGVLVTLLKLRAANRREGDRVSNAALR